MRRPGLVLVVGLALSSARASADPDVGTDAVVSQPRRGFFDEYLSGLGGLEVAAFYGGARVRTVAFDPVVRRDIVAASGDATSRGYRIQAYAIPERSGLFFHPTAGFLSQEIEISGFRAQIPSYELAGTENIPSVESDPSTGQGVDPDQPDVYQLAIRSLYVGQRAGVNKVWQGEATTIFLGVQGGFNLLEARHLGYRIGRVERGGWQAAFAQSAAGTATVGLGIRPWHIALRVEGKYEHYRSFELPRELSFPGNVYFDPERNAASRSDLRVKTVDYQTYEVQAALSAFF